MSSRWSGDPARGSNGSGAKYQLAVGSIRVHRVAHATTVFRRPACPPLPPRLVGHDTIVMLGERLAGAVGGCNMIRELVTAAAITGAAIGGAPVAERRLPQRYGGDVPEDEL